MIRIGKIGGHPAFIDSSKYRCALLPENYSLIVSEDDRSIVGFENVDSGLRGELKWIPLNGSDLVDEFSRKGIETVVQNGEIVGNVTK